MRYRRKAIGISIMVMMISLLVICDLQTAKAKPAEKTVNVFIDSLTDSTTGMEFVFVNGGCFSMGDVFGDGAADEKPVHEVCVNDFFIGRYEVTQDQWRKVMISNPALFQNCGGKCPIENVSWDDVQGYIVELNRLSRKKYRLPTEAEWEYAARSGGKKEKWAGTSELTKVDEYAWQGISADIKTHLVGQKKPNGLALYDMSGNVWEWCHDWYGGTYFTDSPRNNPQNSTKVSLERVVRGGGWDANASYARTTSREGAPPDKKIISVGFRLVRDK